MFRIRIAGVAAFVTLTGSLAAQSPTPRTHRLEASPATVAYGYYWADARPVLRIASGDIIDVDTLLTNTPMGLQRAGVPLDKIQESLEAIVAEVTGDRRGPGGQEQAMGWYYYLEDKIHFPFQARCIGSDTTSPLLGETVEVRRMAPEDPCAHDMLVSIRWQNRRLAVPLSRLEAVDPDETTAEAIGDWHYWVSQGYLL